MFAREFKKCWDTLQESLGKNAGVSNVSNMELYYIYYINYLIFFWKWTYYSYFLPSCFRRSGPDYCEGSPGGVAGGGLWMCGRSVPVVLSFQKRGEFMFRMKYQGSAFNKSFLLGLFSQKMKNLWKVLFIVYSKYQYTSFQNLSLDDKFYKIKSL